jgi:antitoxin (DNA-binding transcriptional repressor) of toxin-antitoxin stability system
MTVSFFDEFRNKATPAPSLYRPLQASYSSQMKKASITDAKNRLSALIDGLKGGSGVLIVDRGRPVARLEPVTAGPEDGQDGKLSRLVREGVVRPRRAAPPRALFSSQPPHAKSGASVIDILLEERRQGR